MATISARRRLIRDRVERSNELNCRMGKSLTRQPKLEDSA